MEQIIDRVIGSTYPHKTSPEILRRLDEIAQNNQKSLDAMTELNAGKLSINSTGNELVCYVTEKRMPLNWCDELKTEAA